ncbi:Hypothetical predicted protein [Cloeon dipterum]|uniref:F-box domain-containing protein n=1 Tax=Cloeon dipterum TaxID=197152 RepID=A0A8S1D541_9INSE|nr:Hypothetical predicted protein [Cloeon dipterum]
MFPSASHLQIVWQDDWTHNEQELIAMLSFSTISTLSLENAPSKEIVYRFLAKYGGDLISLRVLSLKYIFLDIITIFDCCPNLRTLFLTDVLLIKDPTIEICNFSKLAHLFWKNHKHCDFKVSCLSSILLAPQLKTMEIDLPHDTFDVNDLERLASYISYNKPLGNLIESISGCIRFNSAHVVDHDSEIVKSVSKIIKTASAHLPNLTHLKVTHRFESPILEYLDIILPENNEIVDVGESVLDWFNDPTLILFLKAGPSLLLRCNFRRLFVTPGAPGPFSVVVLCPINSHNGDSSGEKKMLWE